MRVKLEWLNELVDLSGLSLKEIVDKASLYSIEIENVCKVVSGTNLVIGHVLTKNPHPDSDHLNLLTVDVGEEVLDIVCGAPNVQAGQYVIVAKIGAKLPGGEIKKSKIRGYESCGMCCSLQELGLESKFIPEKFANGIYYFEDFDELNVKLGSNALEALHLNDEVLELGLTPNRGDLMSMIGVAYEFSASFNRPLKPLAYTLLREKVSKSDELKIKIETEDCYTYYGQLIKNVKIKESPRWLKSRVIAFGARAINNAVDITNYVLALFGQPLHAFDYKCIGKNIVIRNAHENEKFVTLDEVERELNPKDIVITNGKDAMCLGGVMGGLNSEVTESTKDIMLEAAVFNPNAIRYTSSRLNLHSESSNRFEKGVDINRTKLALDYACYLFKELCDAEIVGEAKSDGILEVKDKELYTSKEKVNKVLGTNISSKEIIDIFNKLGFKAEEEGKKIKVYIPNRRFDISIEEDLIEEVGRIYGYEHLPLTIPLDRMCGELSYENKNKRILADALVGLGLHEVVTYSLVSKDANEKFNVLNKENQKAFKLLMPLSEEHQYLRYSLVPSSIDVLKYNINRNIKDLSNFEIAKVYYEVDGVRFEDMHLSITMTNTYSSLLWQGKQEKVDFFVLKGIVEEAFKKLGVAFTFTPLNVECKELHPNRSALLYLEDKLVGYMGQLHPEYAHQNDLDDVYVCEIDLSDILPIKPETKKYVPIQKNPSAERDIAIVVKKDVLASDIINAIKKADRQYLQDAYIFDLYEGSNLKEDEKSIAIKLIFSSKDTLTDELVNQRMKKILKDLEYRVNAKLRN